MRRGFHWLHSREAPEGGQDRKTKRCRMRERAQGRASGSIGERREHRTRCANRPRRAPQPDDAEGSTGEWQSAETRSAGTVHWGGSCLSELDNRRPRTGLEDKQQFKLNSLPRLVRLARSIGGVHVCPNSIIGDQGQGWKTKRLPAPCSA